MNEEALRALWRAEESVAHIHGWDFSHLDGRYTEEDDLPWDYRQLALEGLKESDRLLDTDTGGGEFLLSLNHPHRQTAATEGYPPNVSLCEKELLPLGIDFREAADCAALPFEDARFDRIINRHGDFCPREIHRLLRPGGLFVTQQVGARNDRELVDLLLPGTPLPFPDQTAERIGEAFRQAGFCVLRCEECFRPIRFFDVGALVWFARIIEWEFPGFSVDSCFPRLLSAQRVLEAEGELSGTTHRVLLIARKPE